MSSTTHTEQAPRGAVRLIVEYDGDRLSLVSQQRVDMALPRPDVRGQPSLSPGHYAEVRGLRWRDSGVRADQRGSHHERGGLPGGGGRRDHTD